MADQVKDFDAESKEAIKTVFMKFDKDKSGEIDFSEVKLVSEELGIKLETDDIQKIFQDLDINKDKKISFSEFWEWWKLGRPNKLEKMVYYKLKSLKLLKKAHSEFVRMGESLDIKYNSNIDSFYGALNYGSHPGETRIQVKLLVNNAEADELIRETLEGLNRNENEQDSSNIIAFVIRIKSNQPEKAATDINFLITSLKNLLLQLAGSSQNIQFVTLINMVKIQVQSYKEEVIIKFSFPPDFIQGFIGDDLSISQMINFYTEQYYQTNLNVSFTAGIKNSLKLIASNMNQKFVDWIFEGFLFEFKATGNHSFVEQIFKHGMTGCEFTLQLLKTNLQNNLITKEQYDASVSSLNSAVILLMLRSAKLHLVFRDIDNVRGFFTGMGLEDLANSQPSCKELLEELKEDFPFFKLMKDQNSLWNILYKFFNCFQETCEGQATISLIYRKVIIQTILSVEGLGEIFKFLVQ